LFLLEKLLEKNIIDDCVIFIESTRSPGSTSIGKYNINLHTVPNIYESRQFLDNKKDVLFFRGGFRSWHDFIIDMQKEENLFCMLYAANTGRERWPFWDLILEDMHTTEEYIDERGRIWHPFLKPVNTDIFYPDKSVKQIYDICIGASHISDKKGQWRIVEGLIEYQKMFLKNKLKCILPGCGSKGTHTAPMFKKIREYNLEIALPGMVDRKELAKIYNKSKYFFYGGSGGQNDRSLLEASACGIEVFFVNKDRHPPYFNKMEKLQILDGDDFKKIALSIDTAVNKLKLKDKTEIKNRYEKNNGIHLTLEQFKNILSKKRS
jgi:hypothetical protein